VKDARLLTDAVGGKDNAVRGPAALDHGLAELTREYETHCEDRLERIPLGAAGRAYVSFARRDPGPIIENVGDCLAGDSGPLSVIVIVPLAEDTSTSQQP
jgi:hypothetical protein